MGSVDDNLDVHAKNSMGITLKEFAMEKQLPKGDADDSGDTTKTAIKTKTIRRLQVLLGDFQLYSMISRSIDLNFTTINHERFER